MPTFPLGFWANKVDARNNALKASIGRQTQTTHGNITWTRTASDHITLRGIPAIGYGVAGHIPGTRPDALANIRDLRHNPH